MVMASVWISRSICGAYCLSSSLSIYSIPNGIILNTGRFQARDRFARTETSSTC